VKTSGAINRIKQPLPKRLPSPMCQNQHAHSTARLHHIVYRAVWLCIFATGAKFVPKAALQSLFYGIR